MLVGMTTDLVSSISYSTNNSGMLLGNPSQTEECSSEVATIECFENFIHSFVEPDFEFIPFEILRIIVMIVPVFYVKSQDIHRFYLLVPFFVCRNFGLQSLRMFPQVPNKKDFRSVNSRS